MDISNGEGVGVALFVQGCRFACKNCFNPDTWDFNGGKEWTQETEDKLVKLASRPYIKRLSILGGEPLVDENLDGVLHLVDRFRLLFPNKFIWLYTGYTLSIRDFDTTIDCGWDNAAIRNYILAMCDVVIDGPYIEEQRDITLAFRGSKNQRLIDVKETLNQGKIITLNTSK